MTDRDKPELDVSVDRKLLCEISLVAICQLMSACQSPESVLVLAADLIRHYVRAGDGIRLELAMEQVMAVVAQLDEQDAKESSK